MKRCLHSLGERFSDDFIKVNEATANASRICKLYGTMVRKGDSTANRPHRRSHLLETPERISPVREELLISLANEAAPAPSMSRTMNSYPAQSFDIDSWLANSGLEIAKGPEPYQGGRRWILRRCPFNPDHERPAVIQHTGGAITYTCLHNSCSENNWKTLRQRIDPDYRSWGQQSERTALANRAPADDSRGLITDLSQIPSVFSMESQLDWCVENMIARSAITLICAESGTGKTWVGYFIAGCVAHGTPVLGLRVNPGRVLYLDGENPLCVAKQRLFDLGISDSPNLTVWGGWNLSPPVGPENPLVIEFVKKHRPLLVYDSLIEFHPGSEQSSTETRAFMRHFRALANLGASIVILHHTGKAETSKLYRGSSDIKAAVDTAYLLARDTSEPGELGELSMTCFKARLAPGRNFDMRFSKGQGFQRCDSSKPIRTVPELITELLEKRPNVNQSVILDHCLSRGCSKRQVLNSLKNGNWQRIPGPKNSTLFSLPPEREEDSRG